MHRSWHQKQLQEKMIINHTLCITFFLPMPHRLPRTSMIDCFHVLTSFDGVGSRARQVLPQGRAQQVVPVRHLPPGPLRRFYRGEYWVSGGVCRDEGRAATVGFEAAEQRQQVAAQARRQRTPLVQHQPVALMTIRDARLANVRFVRKKSLASSYSAE